MFCGFADGRQATDDSRQPSMELLDTARGCAYYYSIRYIGIRNKMQGMGETTETDKTTDKTTGADIFAWGRLSEAAFLILVSLAGGPKHGYSMMDDIAAFAEVKLRAGTLYGALARLEERGLVETLPTTDRRRPYRLTPAGQAMLQTQLASLDVRVAIGRQRLAADLAS